MTLIAWMALRVPLIRLETVKLQQRITASQRGWEWQRRESDKQQPSLSPIQSYLLPRQRTLIVVKGILAFHS